MPAMAFAFLYSCAETDTDMYKHIHIINVGKENINKPSRRTIRKVGTVTKS